MRLINLWVPVIVLIFTLTMVISFPETRAAPQASIYEMEVSASPAVQSKSLPIEIECEIGFGGACCYTVYAHDVSAEIFLPENITLIGGNKVEPITSSGQTTGRVAAVPGGKLTWLSQSWTIVAEEYGEYSVEVIVTGKSEGGDKFNESRSVNIVIKPGASISLPILPRTTEINEEIIIVVKISSSESDLENVTLFYSKNKQDWSLVPMENTEGEVWVGIIPSQSKEGRIYYYMVSITEKGEIFTTETYSIQVKDMARIGMIKVLTTYGTLAVFILGVGLIFFKGKKGGKKGKSPFISKGMMILGASLRLSALREVDEIQDYQERLRKLRKWVILLLLIVTIIFLVMAIITGQLQDVVSHTTNPTEA